MSRIYELDFELPEPIEIANTKTGLMEKTSVVNLRAPSRKNAIEASRIKNLCTSAMMKASGGLSEDEKARIRIEQEKKSSQGIEEETLDGNGILTMLYAAGETIDFDNLFKMFERLLCNGCGYILDQPITSGVLELLSFEDYEDLLGEFIANFLMRSRQRNTSG